MQFKRIAFIACIAVLSLETAYASGTIYQVEPKSKQNTITLDLTNRLSSPLTSLSVAVLRRPNWVNVSSATLDVASLPVDSTGHVSIAFDVLPAVQRGEVGEVAIVLFAGRSPILQKTISLMVAVPTVYELGQNYPNPFNPVTTIHYQLPADGFVTLKVFDLLGREVATLVNEDQKADYYKINFDAGRLASGVYFYRLQAGDFTAVKRLMLLR